MGKFHLPSIRVHHLKPMYMTGGLKGLNIGLPAVQPLLPAAYLQYFNSSPELYGQCMLCSRTVSMMRPGLDIVTGENTVLGVRGREREEYNLTQAEAE